MVTISIYSRPLQRLIRIFIARESPEGRIQNIFIAGTKPMFCEAQVGDAVLDFNTAMVSDSAAL